MKRLISLLLACILIFLLSACTPNHNDTKASETISKTTSTTKTEKSTTESTTKKLIVKSEYLADNAKLFSSVEKDKIIRKLDDVRNKCSFDIVILTTNTFDGKVVDDYADDYYVSNDYGNDGCIFVMNMNSREWHIAAFGDGKNAVGREDTIEDISNEFLPKLKENKYCDAMLIFIEQVERLVNHTENITSNNDYDNNSILWEKIPENSNFRKNYIAYSYKMGPGTFIDKINFVGKVAGVLFAFTWAGDVKMNGYTRRIFTPGGIKKPNSGQSIGYYVDIIERGDESLIVQVVPFVQLSGDYDGDKKQALATLIVLALYAYGEIPLGHEFSNVYKKIMDGNAVFRYNDFLIHSQTDEHNFFATIFKSDSAMIQKLEILADKKIEDYAY